MSDTKTVSSVDKIRSQSRLYRAVCPGAYLSGGAVRIDGKLIIEVAGRDSVGDPNWTKVVEIVAPTALPPKGDDRDFAFVGGSREAHTALYELLSRSNIGG